MWSLREIGVMLASALGGRRDGALGGSSGSLCLTPHGWHTCFTVSAVDSDWVSSVVRIYRSIGASVDAVLVNVARDRVLSVLLLCCSAQVHECT